MKIAKFKLYGSDGIWPYFEHMDGDSDWIQMSETVDVDFIDLPAELTIPPQIALIDKGIEVLRTETDEKIARLLDQKKNLLSLSHDGD